ncbi:FliH/SctL family protein [Gemmatimonas sp.]|uniref:FliH/SctL family protein n=1 Tax=Gemmatimonas sp. TaxID=1962908 RepID=UPI00286D8734|nr:FliH/SctL family protein [Gemmatimonas sp.]
MRATAWSLDEFAVADGFGEFTPAETRVPAQTPGDLEADFQARLAVERSRSEAAAYSRGRADGERAARAGVDEEIASAMALLSEALNNVQLHESRWVSNAEENIAAIAVMVARHIVQREVNADPSFVRDVVQSAMAQYPLDQEITIRINPEDLNACRASIEEAGRREIRWISDASILRGGCLMEGRERIIDGRVDTALERAYRTLGGVHA